MTEQLLKLDILMQLQPAPVENSSGLIGYLPQYAALITASVAILLFAFKEIIEMQRKKTIKKNTIVAIRQVAGRETYSLLLVIDFIVDLAAKCCKINYINKEKSSNDLWMVIYFNNYDNTELHSTFCPALPCKFGHEFLLETSRVSSELCGLLSSMNHGFISVISLYNKVINHARNGETNEMLNACISFSRDNVDESPIKLVSILIMKFKNEMSEYDGFDRVRNNIADNIRWLKENNIIPQNNGNKPN